jgi:hypothetical protein
LDNPDNSSKCSLKKQLDMSYSVIVKYNTKHLSTR